MQLRNHNQTELENDSAPLVSVIIATCERADVLQQCLERIFAQEYKPFEVIIVDNSTNDDTQQIVKKFDVGAYIRKSPDTDNVSYLKNVGLNHSRGPIVAFLDDDSLIQPGWMQAVVEAFEDPNVGGVTGRVIESNRPEDCSPVIATLSPSTDMICNFNNLWPEPTEIDYLYGCNMSWRRTALVASGALDPWMSYSREEQEWSLRVKKAGYKLVFYPGVTVNHLRAPRVAKAVQRNSTADFRSRFIQCRSLTYQYARHFGLSKDLLGLTFWQLPKGDLWHFFQSPSSTRAALPFATIGGVLSGYLLASLANIGLHSLPQVSENDAVDKIKERNL